MIIAKIRVNGAIAKTVYRKVIPAGIIGAQVEFDYDEDIWHELHKTVVFKGAVTKDVVTDANIVTIPHEVVEKPFFRLSIGVYGVDADGNIVIPTLWENIGAILDAAAPSGDTSADPSLPVWAQIQAMIGDLSNLTTTAKENLVAAINEAAKSGGGGGSASIAMRIDGGFIQYSTDNGKTWVNLIAEADLKGDKGDKGDTGSTGAAGKSAYQYAVEGGYTGTEAEFSARMAADIPTVDTTLTQSGKAADAAVAGNRLSALSEEIITTAESKVAAHNAGTDTHSDIRLLIQSLTDRLNALADSDDTTLDQLSEIVAYIKSNKSLIDAITTDKVSVADIVDNLTTNVSNKPLSAAQGVALKTMLDAALGAYITDIDALVGGDG